MASATTVVKTNSSVIMNDAITAIELRVINENGVQIGIIPTAKAKELAQQVELDLILIAPDANPPVAKILDYGKYKYEAEVKERENRKHQKNADMKEMRFRLKVDTNDFNTKIATMRKFLKAGDKVKAQVMFRGREVVRPEDGILLLNKVAAEVEDCATVAVEPSAEGRNATMMLNPLAKKEKTVSEQKRRGDETKNARAARQAARLAAKGLDVNGKPLRKTASTKPTAETTEITETTQKSENSAKTAKPAKTNKAEKETKDLQNEVNKEDKNAEK